ncbi:hypothetical protein F0T03_16000 [Yersinia canariae]|uniref:Uncharacterized protein n=1 Tax=Yersinia canariae TaxID=2607663 RepID=A0A857F1D3_9GAMM|nr:hypothetical protein F0T03_16000 [Yersinia canariae]
MVHPDSFLLYLSSFKLQACWLRSITYLSKLIEIHSLAVFLHREICGIYAEQQAFNSNNISLLHLCDQCAIKIHFLSIKVCFGMEIV